MTDSTLPGVLWIPTSNFFANREGQGPPRWLILHGTAGGTDAAALGNFFKGTEGSDNPVSSTYGIGQDGAIAQYVAERDGAWGNGVVTAGHDPWWSETDSPNPNNVTISIEHCKPDTANATPLTAPQQASSFALAKDICMRNGIPMRQADAQGGIIGHYSIDPVNRARCPGTYPWSALWAYLAQGGTESTMPLQITDPFAAAHYTATDAQHWTCKDNGIVIQDGILAYYQLIQGAARLPRTPEIYGAIAGHPDIVLQIYEGGAIVYVPTLGTYDNPGVPGGGHCFLIHLDQDNVALRKLMALAGLQPATVTTEQVSTVLTAMKSAQASLAVGVSTLEPVVSP